MSFAMAPPIETIWVPGTTGTKKPRGSANEIRSAIVSPASQRTTPVLSSKEMKRSRRPVVSTTPPSFRQTSP